MRRSATDYRLGTPGNVNLPGRIGRRNPSPDEANRKKAVPKVRSDLEDSSSSAALPCPFSHHLSRYWLGVMPVAFLNTVKKWLFVWNPARSPISVTVQSVEASSSFTFAIRSCRM